MTAHIVKALRTRYNTPEWAVFTEVRSSTGHDNVITFADAIAVSTYASRGYSVLGFEFKVSRSDWLRELKTPDKAEVIAAFCDEWWLVIDDIKIIRDDEIPVNWGVLVLKSDGKLHKHKAAVRKQGAPWTREFTASLLRNAVKVMDSSIPKSEIESRIQTEVNARIDHQEKMDAMLAENINKKQQKLATDADILQQIFGYYNRDTLVRDFGWVRQIVEAERQQTYDGGDAWVLRMLDERIQKAQEYGRALAGVRSQLQKVSEP